ncbi:MAG: DUF3823 domain-containing protein [Duncaniella sp.]|nr:DUF3823 domain-containing protein [Duncaniella sp.]MDE7146284.1 DUF3823 domain-containing protein [Duncaniella sp.]
MKKIIYSALCLLTIGLTACDKDNYSGPEETFCGKFIDKETGEPFQTAMGNTGIRIRMMEYSWSDNPQPYDFNVKQDGSFMNTKIFGGEYGVTPSGAFVPLPEERIKIYGRVDKTYEIEPLLRVEWVGEPQVNTDGSVEVKVKVTRGTTNPDYQDALAEAWLFVSETNYVGDFSFSNVYSTKIAGAAIASVKLGEITTVRTGQPGGYNPGGTFTPFPDYTRKYFLRFGARTTRQFDGVNRYNYSTIKEVTTPAR